MKTLIVNARVVTPFRAIEDAAVLISDAVIEEVIEDYSRRPATPVDRVIDGRGLLLTPGLIDLHVHGGGGVDATGNDASDIVHMCEAHARHGTTSIVPTTFAAPIDTLGRTLREVDRAMKLTRRVHILGTHLEGNYLSLAQAGAQSHEYIKNPCPAEYEALLDQSDHILMMGAAPELPGGLALGRALRDRGIVASIAHTDGTTLDVVRALENGYTDVTHIYSGCSMVVRKHAYRVGGVVEGGYLRDELTVQVIADGKHLPAELLRLLYKVKGANRISLITDGLSFSADDTLREGATYRQVNGIDVVYEDGVMKLPDRESFAGSVATSSRLVRNMRVLADVPLCEAVAMATYTPARVLGVARHKGVIAAGYDADLVLFDEAMESKLVMVGGEIAFDFLNEKA